MIRSLPLCTPQGLRDRAGDRIHHLRQPVARIKRVRNRARIRRRTADRCPKPGAHQAVEEVVSVSRNFAFAVGGTSQVPDRVVGVALGVGQRIGLGRQTVARVVAELCRVIP